MLDNESIVYFLLINFTRDIFLRSCSAALDYHVDAALKGRVPTKVSASYNEGIYKKMNRNNGGRHVFN